MTREEAIQVLEEEAEYLYQDDRPYNREAFDMAIEALQADAVNVAHDIPEYCSWSQTYTNMVQSAMADTKSADAEPQTEHDREWIIGCIKHDGFIKTDRFDKANQIILDALSADAVQGEWKHTITWQPYCSNCEYVFGEGEEFSPFWKYCPMCGARMKEGAE